MRGAVLRADGTTLYSAKERAMFAAPRSPQPPTLPGLQMLRRSFDTMPEFFRETTRDHGPIVRFRAPFRSFYLLDEPSLIEELFVQRGADFMKGRGAERLSRLLGRGLLTAREPQHLTHRRMVQPAFHRNRMGGWATIMTSAAHARVATWRPGQTIELDREMNRLALEVVAKALFGTDLSNDVETIAQSLDELAGSFSNAMMPLSEVFDYLPLPATLRFNAAKRRLDDIVYRMLREHREGGEDRGDLLSMLLATRDEDDGVALTDEQIRDEAITILLAGHETTANAMAWTWYLLQRHQSVERRFHAQVDEVLADGRAATLEDLPRLDYVTAVFSEAMRLYPPAWITARRALRTTKIGEYTIPRGDLVIASPYVTGRNPRYFERPDDFDPERFLGRTFPKFAFFPFGGGNRLCIGERFAWMEGVLILASLAQRLRFESIDDRAVAMEPLVTLRPKTPIYARVAERLPTGSAFQRA